MGLDAAAATTSAGRQRPRKLGTLIQEKNGAFLSKPFGRWLQARRGAALEGCRAATLSKTSSSLRSSGALQNASSQLGNVLSIR
jgi:hypothetical protein